MNNDLVSRYRNNQINRFQKCQTETFLSLLDNKYSDVLDIGCGKGYFSYVGAKYNKFVKCYGCDIYNDYKKDEIRPLVKKIDYRNIRNNKLPFQNDRFQLVFSMDVIEHVDDGKDFVKESIRVCKSGGEIIIGTPNYYRITNLLLMLIGSLKFPRKMGEDSYGDVIHKKEYSRNDILNLLSYFKARIEKSSIKIVPCWYGLMALNIGIDKIPKIFEDICQFWFVKFNKV